MARDINSSFIAQTTINNTTPVTGVIDAKTSFGNYTRGIPVECLVTSYTAGNLTFSIETSDTVGFTVIRENLIMAPAITAAGSYKLTIATRYRYVRARLVGASSPNLVARVDALMAAQ